MNSNRKQLYILYGSYIVYKLKRKPLEKPGENCRKTKKINSQIIRVAHSMSNLPYLTELEMKNATEWHILLYEG